MSAFDLEAIKKAARAQKLEYGGRKVFRDVENLGYVLSDVIDCICKLTDQDFDKIHRYDECEYEDDAYETNFKKHGNEQFDLIYLKVRLINQDMVVVVGAFHL